MGPIARRRVYVGRGGFPIDPVFATTLELPVPTPDPAVAGASNGPVELEVPVDPDVAVEFDVLVASLELATVVAPEFAVVP